MIPLFYTKTSPKEAELLHSVLESGKLVNGPHAPALETEITDYLGVKGGTVVCASGTDALIMALEQTGCEEFGVIVPAMTFSATYEAVLRARATPVVCDVDTETATPTVEMVRDALVSAIGSGIPVRAVIIVHLYGWPAHDFEAISEFVRSQDLILIEDCAQCFGARIGEMHMGTVGDAAAFSFYPTKPLGGISDGGAVCFSSSKMAEYARSVRNHGRTPHSGQDKPGYNSRMGEANAAILRARLWAHSNNLEHRRAISGRYHVNGIKKLSIKRTGRGIPYVYPIMVDEREAIRFRLAEIGVETGIHYDPPVSMLPYVNADCPNAKWVSRRILSLPCHQGMTDADVDRISDALRTPN